MPLYRVNAVVWLDTDDEVEAESLILDKMWHNYDDVPSCDVRGIKKEKVNTTETLNAAETGEEFAVVLNFFLCGSPGDDDD